MSYNNAINTDGKLARAFGAHSFAAGYGGRWASGCDLESERKSFMRRNRILVFSILTIFGVAFSLTLLAQGSAPADASTASAVGRFTLVPLNFEYQQVKLATLVRVDSHTGQTWIVNVRLVPQQGQQPLLTWEWIDLREAGTKPKP